IWSPILGNPQGQRSMTAHKGRIHDCSRTACRKVKKSLPRGGRPYMTRHMMLDINNRPGGPNLIVTAKTAHKVHFLDAATLTMTSTLDMPGSTHEMAMTADGRTVFATIYGDGIFGKNRNPDRRLAVIDLPSKSLTRTIDLGATVAPHGIMMD